MPLSEGEIEQRRRQRSAREAVEWVLSWHEQGLPLWEMRLLLFLARMRVLGYLSVPVSLFLKITQGMREMRSMHYHEWYKKHANHWAVAYCILGVIAALVDSARFCVAIGAALLANFAVCGVSIVRQNLGTRKTKNPHV